MSPAAFSAAAAAWVLAVKAMTPELNTMTGQVNTVSGEVNTNAGIATAQAAAAIIAGNSAAASALNAANSAGVAVWITGTSYVIGNPVYDPLNAQSYRRKTNGAGSTNPSLDPTNWMPVSSSPAAALVLLNYLYGAF
jgi:hypothetical protein